MDADSKTHVFRLSSIILLFLYFFVGIAYSSEIEKRCDSLEKVLSTTENHLEEASSLLKRIDERNSTCLCPTSEDVKDLIDSVNEVQSTFQIIKTNSRIDDDSATTTRCPSALEIRPPRDCADIKQTGTTTSGRYIVFPDDEEDPFYVFCDMDTDGGGWTVFQRRLDGGTNFYATWTDYKYGFGQLTGEHWLGNDKIHRLSSQKSYELRVDLEDFENGRSYAVYDQFEVEDEEQGYRLSVGTYNGTAGDSLSYHNGQKFTTRDRDNDGSRGNCAKLYTGAWWYQRCLFSNLNGKYYEGGKLASKGASWYHWKNSYYSVKMSEMKIRPVTP